MIVEREYYVKLSEIGKENKITNKEKFKDMESYCAADKMDRTGVAAVAKNRGTLHCWIWNSNNG